MLPCVSWQEPQHQSRQITCHSKQNLQELPVSDFVRSRLLPYCGDVYTVTHLACIITSKLEHEDNIVDGLCAVGDLGSSRKPAGARERQGSDLRQCKSVLPLA